MTTYKCDKMRPISHGAEFIRYDRHGEPTSHSVVESAKEAAHEFADRIARKVFGKRGYCHHVRLDGASTSGQYANYEAFIGVPAQGGGTNGHNIWLTVYVEPIAEPGRLGAWQ